jgi:hypothetical protein
VLGCKINAPTARRSTFGFWWRNVSKWIEKCWTAGERYNWGVAVGVWEEDIMSMFLTRIENHVEECIHYQYAVLLFYTLLLKDFDAMYCLLSLIPLNKQMF